MSTLADPGRPRSDDGWFSRAEGWLDDRGKGAWIAAMVLGFVFFWPVGLALLFYMIWSKRMFSGCRSSRREFRRERFEEMREAMFSRRAAAHSAMRPSGNSAFDAYKAETLQRLMDEQDQFEAFLDRLRAAKDKQEFDAFMDERAEAGRKSRADADDSEIVEQQQA